MDKLDQNNFREQTAEILLKLEAIKLSPNNPFTWASGWKSPIYCDNRIILSDSNSRNLIADNFVKIIKDKYNDTELIAGVATGAIGIGILVAQKLDLPFIYVRPEAKKHGRKNQIEGKISQNQKVIVIEETGIKNLSIVKPLEKTYHIFKRRNNHYLKSTYWFEMYSDYSGKFKPQKKEGISRVEWIGFENLESVLPKSYANIRLLFG